MFKKSAILLSLIGSFLTPYSVNTFELDLSNVDKTDVISDLSDGVTDLTDYYQVESVTFIDFYEYCYGDFNNYELLLYLAIPSNYNIENNSSLNKIQISIGNSNTYYKKSLKLLDHNNNIYKFKVLLNNDDLNYYKNVLDSNNRRYKVSGVELKFVNNANPEEFKIGFDYSYSGYAKGINEESKEKSTLKRTYQELTTLDLEVNSSVYRFHDNYGDFKQQDLNSVYFSIPNDYLEKYGEVSNISAEYYEYRLADLVVLKTSDYEIFKDYVGVKTTKDNHPEFALMFDYEGQVGTNTEYYNFEGAGFEGSEMFKPFEKTNLITILFDGGENGDNEIKSDQILDYLYNYDKSYFNGSNYKGISNDLFDGVDEGHTLGYNRINISSLDSEDLLVYEGNSSWDRFWNMVFNSNKEIDVPLIEKVTSSKTSGEVYIDEDDINDFNTYVSESNLNNKTTYVLRYSLTDYYTYGLRDYRYGDISSVGRDGYVSKQSIFLDFDVISLTFEKEGNNTIIPVIANPIDIVGDTTVPENNSENFLFWFLKVLKIAIGIIVILFIIFLLNFLLNLLGISIKDILNFLFVKPFKWIKSKFSKKKKYKNSVNSKKKVKNKMRYKKKYNAKK